MVKDSFRKGQIEGFQTLNIHDVIETEIIEICIPLGSDVPYGWLNPSGKSLFVLIYGYS